MDNTLRIRFFGSDSGNNRKSKTSAELSRSIQNLQWLALCTVLLALSFPAEAQQRTKVSRIGFLSAGSSSTFSARTEAFRQGLRDLNYVEGKNIVIEWRFALDVANFKENRPGPALQVHRLFLLAYHWSKTERLPFE